MYRCVLVKWKILTVEGKVGGYLIADRPANSRGSGGAQPLISLRMKHMTTYYSL